jgi:DTW domain-containing protein
MSRGANPTNRCTACQMHLSVCICALIPEIETRTRLVLILHQLERAKTTNTGRLAARCLTNSVVAVRGAGAVGDPASLWSLPGTSPLLLYPHSQARPLEEWRSSSRPIVLVVPDGTWRQAAKARARIVGLDQIACATLPADGVSRYRLRHGAHPDRLATIEAIAVAMGVLEGPEVARQLDYIFRVMVDRTLWTNGRLPTHAVTGGIPPGAEPHDPRGLDRDRRTVRRDRRAMNPVVQ